MFDNFDPITRNTANALDVDAGLRTHMQRVYNFMALGLGITGVTAYLTAQSPEMMQLIFGTPFRYVVLFAPLIMVLFLSARISRMSFASAQTLFWAFAVALGLSLASILWFIQMRVSLRFSLLPLVCLLVLAFMDIPPKGI